MRGFLAVYGAFLVLLAGACAWALGQECPPWDGYYLVWAMIAAGLVVGVGMVGAACGPKGVCDGL